MKMGGRGGGMWGDWIITCLSDIVTSLPCSGFFRRFWCNVNIFFIIRLEFRPAGKGKKSN